MEKTPKKWQKVRIFDSYNDANELRCIMIDNDDTGLLEKKFEDVGPMDLSLK